MKIHFKIAHLNWKTIEGKTLFAFISTFITEIDYFRIHVNDGVGPMSAIVQKIKKVVAFAKKKHLRHPMILLRVLKTQTIKNM